MRIRIKKKSIDSNPKRGGKIKREKKDLAVKKRKRRQSSLPGGKRRGKILTHSTWKPVQKPMRPDAVGPSVRAASEWEVKRMAKIGCGKNNGWRNASAGLEKKAEEKKAAAIVVTVTTTSWRKRTGEKTPRHRFSHNIRGRFLKTRPKESVGQR